MTLREKWYTARLYVANWISGGAIDRVTLLIDQRNAQDEQNRVALRLTAEEAYKFEKALRRITRMTTNNTGGRDKAMARVAKEALNDE